MARTSLLAGVGVSVVLSCGAAIAQTTAAPQQAQQPIYLGDPKPVVSEGGERSLTDPNGVPNDQLAAPDTDAQSSRSNATSRRSNQRDAQGADEGNKNPSNRRARPGELVRKSNRLEVGARSGLTYTDNINRAPRGLETGGWIAELSPYADGDYRSPNARGDLYLAMRNFFRTETGSSFADLDLRANGDLAVAGDWLWLSGNATVYSFSPEPFDLISVDPAVYSGNVAQYRQFSLSPYVRGRLGNVANYRLSYTHVLTATSNNISLARHDQRIGANIASGPSFSRWTWDANAMSQRRRFDSGARLDRQSAQAALYRVFGPQFRLGLIATYEKVDGLIGKDGSDSGMGAGLSVDWVPSTRTQFSAKALRQYYGTDSSASATHRFSRLSVGLSYARNVLSSADASVLVFDPAALYSAGGFAPELNPVYETLLNQELLQSFGIPASAGIISDGLVRNQTVNASIGYTMPRNSLVLNLFRSRRESLIDTTGGSGAPSGLLGLIEQTGAGIIWAHRLNANSTWRVSAQRSNVESVTLGSTSRLDTVQTGIRTRFTRRAAAGLGLRRTWQRGQGLNAASYDETAVFGTLDARF